jgi:hypothetical protein
MTTKTTEHPPLSGGIKGVADASAEGVTLVGSSEKPHTGSQTTPQCDIEFLKEFVAKQAEDEGLWFQPIYVSEAYLQSALRKLHSLIEALP